MSATLTQQLRSVRARQRGASALRCAVWGLFLGAVLAAIGGLTRWLFAFPPGVWLAWSALVIGPAGGWLLGLVWPRDWSEAAHAVDAHYRLKDRTATALEFAARSEAGPLHALQLADAVEHLQQVDARQVVPLRAPRTLPWALLTGAAAIVMLVWPTASAPVSAGPAAPLDFVVAQAERAEQRLKELEAFASQQQNPEIERLVAQLRELIAEMKQPGVDARDALAKLSEMQAMLQQQQAEFNLAQVDAQLQAVGEALSLAEATAPAGKALAAGEMSKAADELDKLEPPKLDRQTERALREKLQRAAAEMQRAGQPSLSEAAKCLAEGLGGDAERFREGARRLAGQCRKQGTRKKLHDLLRRQCECLGECKSECEGGACPAKGKSNKKGGKNWGLGASGNEPGEATTKLGGRNEKLTGQLGDEGDTDTETIQSPEAEQAAQRAYRDKYLEYQKLSEAVLESEPIPLGHRQTIRRYFQAIRPTQEAPAPAQP